jgi:hypothetical protein
MNRFAVVSHESNHRALPMKKLLLISYGIFALLCSLSLSAQTVTIARHDDPLVYELEGRYAKLAAAARQGDMKALNSSWPLPTSG